MPHSGEQWYYQSSLLQFRHECLQKVQFLKRVFLSRRLVEPSLSLFQFVPGLPHALCLFLHRVRGICRVQKGIHFHTGWQMAAPDSKAIWQKPNWKFRAIEFVQITILCGHVGSNGASVRGSCAAAAAGSACAGYCVGGISPPPWQHSQKEPLWWVIWSYPQVQYGLCK